MKRIYYRAILLAFALALLCLAAPGPSRAYCVYNHTDTKFEVCGESCNKCFQKTIKDGHHACCPGGHKGCGGHTFITIWPSPPDDGDVKYGWYVPVQVTSHGWVSLFGKCTGTRDKYQCDEIRAKVHDNDGDVIWEGHLYHLSNTWGRCHND